MLPGWGGFTELQPRSAGLGSLSALQVLRDCQPGTTRGLRGLVVPADPHSQSCTPQVPGLPRPLGTPEALCPAPLGPSAVSGSRDTLPVAAPALLLAQVRPVSVRSFNPAVVYLPSAARSCQRLRRAISSFHCPGEGLSWGPRAHSPN